MPSDLTAASPIFFCPNIQEIERIKALCKSVAVSRPILVAEFA
jgi:hypothetical protein